MPFAGTEKIPTQVSTPPEIVGLPIGLPAYVELPATYVTFAGLFGRVSTRLSSMVADEPVFESLSVYVGTPPVGQIAALTSFETVVVLLVGPMGEKEE